MLSDTGGALAGVTHLGNRMYRREMRKATENKEEEEEERKKNFFVLFLFALFPF